MINFNVLDWWEKVAVVITFPIWIIVVMIVIGCKWAIQNFVGI
jgi:hypothetical protein